MNDLGASRRKFLIGSGVAGASVLLPFSASAATATNQAALAEEAFIWGVPLVLTGRYLDIAAKAGIPFNQFILSPDLATPKTRALGANVDTLYGFAWLDLATTPQVIQVPDTHDRYYSIHLIDAYQNSFAYIGRRATGTKAGAFAITPPGFKGPIPQGVTEIKAPTGKILAFVRTLVRGEKDLPAARAVQESYTLGALSDFPNSRHAPTIRSEAINLLPVIDLSNAGAGYFDELDALVREYPPLPYDAPNLAHFAAIGVGGRAELRRDPALREVLAASVPAALEKVRQQPDDFWVANGWKTKLTVTNFIRDPLVRAGTNLYGPATQVAQEALYFSPTQALTGAKRYRLRFPAGQLLPVDGFWSLGIYGQDHFLIENPIHRYSITDHTDGLRYGADGSLEILIQADQPADSTANWLPAPRDVFFLTVRAYQPRGVILNKTYQLPPLEELPAA